MSSSALAKLATAAQLAVVVGLSAPVAAEAATYITSFQGAKFTVTQNSSTNFTFDITGANALTGDWAGAQYLGAFSFGDINATGAVTATLVNPATGQATAAASGGLDANGCNGSGASFICFNLSPNVPVASDLKFNIATTGGTFNFASTGPDLKILWSNSATVDRSVGSLFSASIPLSAVPEPGSWAMMIVGAGLVGAAFRIRREKHRQLGIPA